MEIDGLGVPDQVKMGLMASGGDRESILDRARRIGTHEASDYTHADDD